MSLYYDKIKSRSNYFSNIFYVHLKIVPIHSQEYQKISMHLIEIISHLAFSSLKRAHIIIIVRYVGKTEREDNYVLE